MPDENNDLFPVAETIPESNVKDEGTAWNETNWVRVHNWLSY